MARYPRNGVAEWHIGVDPVAADEVFTARLETHLVSLDATDQLLWFEFHAEQPHPYRRAAGGPALAKGGAGCGVLPLNRNKP